MNILEKGSDKIILNGFDEIKENQIITIKYFGGDEKFNLVIIPKEEDPIANRAVVKLVGKDIVESVIVELINKYVKKDKTAFIYSDGAYYQDDAIDVDKI